MANLFELAILILTLTEKIYENREDLIYTITKVKRNKKKNKIKNGNNKNNRTIINICLKTRLKPEGLYMTPT